MLSLFALNLRYDLDKSTDYYVFYPGGEEDDVLNHVKLRYQNMKVFLNFIYKWSTLALHENKNKRKIEG